MEIGSDFGELLTLLNESGVKYLVVGAYALAAHGYPRNTKDLDIFFEATPENAVRLMAALEAFGFGSLGLTVDDFDHPGGIVQLGHPPNRIDLISSISGVNFHEAWEGRMRIEAGGLSYHVIGKAEYIRNKLASGRLSDLADVERLGGTP